MCFGSKEGTLARVLAPKRALYHVLTSQGGNLVCFANKDMLLWLPRGNFSTIEPEEVATAPLAPPPFLVHITD